MKWISDLKELLFPRYCKVCGQRLMKSEEHSHEMAASQKLAACRLAECFHPEGTRECNDACFCDIAFSPFGRRTRFVRSV